MTQVVLNISDRSILSGLKTVLTRMKGIESIRVLKSQPEKTKRQEFLGDFREAVRSAKDFKEGRVQYASWEEMTDEL